MISSNVPFSQFLNDVQLPRYGRFHVVRRREIKAAGTRAQLLREFALNMKAFVDRGRDDGYGTIAVTWKIIDLAIASHKWAVRRSHLPRAAFRAP
jgi:hypothetical protein